MSEQNEDEIHVEPRPFKWATPNSDGFNMWLCGEHVYAVSKVMSLTKDQHNELRKLITTPPGRPDIAQNVQYIDMEAAEKVARDHIAANRGTASQGAHSTASALGGENTALKDAPKVDIPNPTATGDGKPLSALAARLQAQNVAKIDPRGNPDDKPVIVPKVFTVTEEADAIHPETMTPEDITNLQNAGKAPVS